MVAAGVLAALVILLSPAFQRETSNFLSEAKAKTDLPAEEQDQFVAVHSDAMTSGQAYSVESVNPFVLQEVIVVEDRQVGPPVPGIAVLASLTRTLLSGVISPQAP